MFVKKISILAVAIFVSTAVFMTGCDDDSVYDQRTVVYVSNINEGQPYMSDVLNQGDSLYYTDTFILKLEDDYIQEDRIMIEFHNRPYNNTLTTPTTSLGDFMVTGYTVEFETLDGSPSPVEAFTGEMNLVVPTNTKVEAYITIVPFYNKANGTTLWGLQYTQQEIMTNAHITFHGHEIQTERNIDFPAGVFVEFADPLVVEDGS